MDGSGSSGPMGSTVLCACSAGYSIRIELRVSCLGRVHQSNGQFLELRLEV